MGADEKYEEMLLAEYVGNIEESGSQLIPALASLKLNMEELCDMQLAAYAWSEEVSRQA